MFYKAQKQIESDIDIVHVIRKLRKLEFVTKILLSKNQRCFLPLYKENVLRETGRERIDAKNVIKEDEDYHTTHAKNIEKY